MAVEQARRLGDLEHGSDRALVFLLDRGEARGVVDEAQIEPGDPHARLGERHLQVLDERCEKRPRAVQPPELLGVCLRERRPGAEPSREEAAVLRPREHPRDRAQRLQLSHGSGTRTRHRP